MHSPHLAIPVGILVVFAMPLRLFRSRILNPIQTLYPKPEFLPGTQAHREFDRDQDSVWGW
jgi:hypothetical protein